MGEGGRACSIYPAGGVGCRGLCVKEKKKNNDSRLYARMATQKWIVSPSMYRDSEEKFFSVFLWRPFILFAGHESLGMQDRGLGTKVLISYVIYTAY